MTLSTSCPKPAPREKRARKPVRKRNRKRYSANWLRAYGSPERIAWVQSRRCVVCGWQGGCENAHVRGGGGSRKADAKWVVPLCGAHPPMPGGAMITRDGDNDIGCHAALHSLGKRSFEKAYYVNLDTLAEQTERAWLAFQRSDTGGER